MQLVLRAVAARPTVDQAGLLMMEIFQRSQSRSYKVSQGQISEMQILLPQSVGQSKSQVSPDSRGEEINPPINGEEL